MGKFALLIGVGEYQSSELQNLAAAVPDVRAIEKVLIDPAIADFAQTDVMVLLNPEPQQMREAIDHLFADRKKDDLILLYFSGHGVTNDSGNFYFTSSITQTNRLNSTAIPATFVHGLMEGSKSQRQVVILDSCFSGAFAKDMKAKGEAVNLQPQLGGQGRAVLTSSSATEYSFEQKEGMLSVYTQYVIEGLQTGIADVNEDGWISVDDLHEFAAAKVREVAPAMKPKIYAVESGYKIILAKAPMGDPELEYRKEVEQWAKKRNGKLSATILMALEEKQQQWDLTSDVTSRIQQEVLRPYKEFDAKIQRYQRALQEESLSSQKITPEAWEDLEYLRQTLGLTNENIQFLVKDVETLSSPAPSEVSETPTPPVPNFFNPLPPVDRSLTINNIPETQPIETPIVGNSIPRFSSSPRHRRDRSLQEANEKQIKSPISCGGLMLALLSLIGAGITLSVIASLMTSPKTLTPSIQSREELSSPSKLIDEEKNRPFIGVQMLDLTPETVKEIRQDSSIKWTFSKETGVLISRVEKDGPAALSGILAGDIFQKVNAKSVTTAKDVSEIIAAIPIGDDLLIEIDRAGKTLTFKIKLAAKPEYLILGQRGMEKAEKKDFKGSVEDYSKVIQLKPDYALAYYSRGSARSNLNDYKGAIEDYTKAIELKSDDVDSYNGRGNVRLNSSDYKGAIEDYTKAIELKPDNVNVYNNRGNARRNLSDNKGAIEDYTKAIGLKPNLAVLYFNRGDSRRNLSDNKGSIEDHTRAIELKPDFAVAYNSRGISRKNLSDNKGAIEDYNKAIELKPDYADAYYNRAIPHKNLGDKNSAIADYQKAADFYQKQGKTQDYQEALEQIKKLQ